MGRRRGALQGRDEVLAALRARAQGLTLTVLQGKRGSGRSSVLARLGREFEAAGMIVLSVTGMAGRQGRDRSVGLPILDVLRDRFEELGGDPWLADAMESLSRLCEGTSHSDPEERARLATMLGTVFERLGARARVALLVDDVDHFASPAPALAEICRTGQIVVAAGEDGGSEDLCALADEVVELGALSDAAASAVLRQAGRAPLDELLHQAVRDGLGPLYGNPGTLVSTMADLRRRGRLSVVHGHLCLRDSREPVALAAGHPMVEEVERCGRFGRDLVALATDGAGFWVDEIPLLASATGESEIDYGRAADRLVLAGVLEADPVGRLSVGCPALGPAVAARVSEESASSRRLIVRRLLDADAGPRSGHLRHVAALGRGMEPRPELAERLREAELLVPALDTEGHAAYRYAAWWHAGTGEPRTRPAFDLVRLFMRTGDYARLATFTAELATDGRRAELDAESRAELAAAAALAALHLGEPVAEPVRAALTAEGSMPAALAFCDRWFAGQPARAADLEAAFAPLLRRSSSPPTIEWRTQRPRRPAALIEEAFAVRDLVPAFESVLGSQYGTPVDGPLGTYHRLRTGYAGEDWAAALSAARRLELEPSADPVAREYARLHAAEMCFWQGEDRRASEWLASVDERTGVFPALRGWVEVARCRIDGGLGDALRAGWRAVELSRERDDIDGLSRLLRRMATVAAESGEALPIRRVQKEAEALDQRRRTPGTHETLLSIGSLLHADVVKAQAAEQLIRSRGNRIELSMACELVGSVAAEPRPWLAEALEIARAIGAARLITRVKKAMTDRGISAAAVRGEAEAEALSEIELRIADLVRRGRTNRQIAHAVGMSEKTVEKYLSRLYVKAGCKSRHGLAASDFGARGESVGA